MANNPQATRTPYGGPLVPPDPKDEGRMLKFLDAVTDHETISRTEFESECAESKAFVEHHQWLDYRGVGSKTQAREFFDMDEEEMGIAMPVQNEIYGMVDTERSRLGKRRSQPYVRPRRGNEVRSKAPAAKADDVIDTTMDNVRWPGKYREWVTDTVRFGIGALSLEMACDYRGSIISPVTTALRCKGPGCGATMASPLVPPKAIGQIDGLGLSRLARTDTLGPDGYQPAYKASGTCFVCGGPMEPAKLTDEDASGKDIFNRPLGTPKPLTDVMLRNRSPWELFVENEGVGLTPGPMGHPGHPNWYCEDYPESLDMIAALYQEGDQVVREDAMSLARTFPMLGVFSSSSIGYRGVADRTVYQNHARLRRFIQGPTRKDPFGRMIVYGGKKRLVDGALYVKSKDDPRVLVPRVSHHVWRFFPRAANFFGLSLVAGLLSPQRRINMTLSQIVMNRETNGNDTWLLTPGMWMGGIESKTGMPGGQQMWRPDPRWPKAVPIRNPGRLMDPNVWQEVKFCVERMQYIAGLMDVDQGKNPGGVTAGTAIEMLAAKSSERRDMREQEGVEACRNIWRDTLAMIREFHDEEERPYYAKTFGDALVRKTFRGCDLKDQLDVFVDEEPSYDVKTFNREQVVLAIDKGVMPIDTAYARREVRKELGISSDVSEGEDVQVEDAERKWHEFESSLCAAMDDPETITGKRPEVKVPPIDENEDDHPTHFSVYGMNWKTEVGASFKEESGWNKALPYLAGWRKDFDLQCAKRDAFDQAVASGAFETALKNVAASNAAVQQEKARGVPDRDIAALGIMAQPADVSMVQEFKSYQRPPDDVATHIYNVWKDRLAKDPQFFVDPAGEDRAAAAAMGPTAALDMAQGVPGGAMPAPPTGTMLNEPLESVMRMKAVTEAHFILDQRRKQAAAMGAAIPAAPAAATTTPAGTEPGPAQPVLAA